MQLESAEESRKLTTFYTRRGLKGFKYLYFRVNSTAEIFNEEVRKIMQHEPNAISIYDDILVFGLEGQATTKITTKKKNPLYDWAYHR